MNTSQSFLVLTYGLLNFCVFLKCFYECKQKKNAFKLVPWLYPLGIYAYGDGVIFGIFWILSAITSYVLYDWILFLLIVSVFWLVRSVGETMYWFNEQFATKHRNEVSSLPLKNIFHNDSIWFIFQIANQCITVVTIITSVYLFNLWLK